MVWHNLLCLSLSDRCLRENYSLQKVPESPTRDFSVRAALDSRLASCFFDSSGFLGGWSLFCMPPWRSIRKKRHMNAGEARLGWLQHDSVTLWDMRMNKQTLLQFSGLKPLNGISANI